MEPANRRYRLLQSSRLFICHQEAQIPHPPSIENRFAMGRRRQSLEGTQSNHQRHSIPPLKNQRFNLAMQRRQRFFQPNNIPLRNQKDIG